MSQQVWTAKAAQDLKPGDLIPGQTRSPYALEIGETQEIGSQIYVKCFSDLYRRFTHTFVMRQNQPVPVAVSGVEHMDKITTFEISR